ncbi:MAG: biopolymer transporter ExbD [Rhodospirillaceae bacterium]|nr:biopolymer transporter ExbD [Rhodospirillaceae bacterium]
MSMSVGDSGGGGHETEMVELNTTPLIDVMLVLLVMLIITIPIQTHAVKLDMPRPNANPPPQEVEPVIIQLGVDFDGTITWDGNIVSDMAVLEGYMMQAADQEPQPEMHLKPNRLAKYEQVAKVLAAAQRNGVVKIGFVGNEQYIQ